MKRPEEYRAGYLKMRSVLHDRATALPAYPMVLDELRRMLDRRRFIGVIHIGIDGIEMVESLYGWQVLDRVLERAAGVLRTACDERMPGGTVLALDRVAGDEFLAFVPETYDGQEVDGGFLGELGEHLCKDLSGSFGAEEFDALGPSLGFRPGFSVLSLSPYHRFERRVYAAVEESRSRDEARKSRRERSQDEELRRIIDASDVRVLFQPVIDLRSAEIHGYEALARGPEDSMFEMPATMFAWSGRVGSGAALDRLCRQVALRESALAAYPGRLFLNVLPGALDDPEWALEQGAVAGSPLDRSNVVLEVSDRGSEDTGRVVAGMERLRELGFLVALDDVGTGFASLATIERVRPDYIKADSSLVRGIHETLIKQEVLTSVVQIAQRLGAKVIAEGVESEDEAAFLREAGADFAQGFLFAAPGPIGSPNGKNERDH